VTTLGPLQGVQQAEPLVRERRLVECQWEVSATLRIPPDWLQWRSISDASRAPPERSDEPYTPIGRVTWCSSCAITAPPTSRCSNAAITRGRRSNRLAATYSLYDDGTPGMTSTPAVVTSASIGLTENFGRFTIILSRLAAVNGCVGSFRSPYWLEARGYNVTHRSRSDMLRRPPADRIVSYSSVRVTMGTGMSDSYHAVAALRDAGVGLGFLFRVTRSTGRAPFSPERARPHPTGVCGVRRLYGSGGMARAGRGLTRSNDVVQGRAR
jgi:hypothetical protein